MKVAKRIRIGEVEVIYLSKMPDNSYSEGEDTETRTEKQLLEIFKSGDAEKRRSEILANGPSWPQRYHLSPQRGNIVSWFDFQPGASVLEVGSGPGAITEALVKKDIRVTSLELTERRSLINAYRNKRSSNLEIVIGNLQDYKPEQKFDYVICVGVLEYSGSFIEEADPYSGFLSMLRNMLKPGGTMLVAIENRFGLKYWAGAPEDHTGRTFDSLNYYPGGKKVRTFGKAELEGLAYGVGFKQIDFYYPFPDYKMPLVIFSDDFLPGADADFPLGLLPSPSPSAPSHYLFSEQSAMIAIQKNALFGQFSNSFLAVVK